MEGLTWFLLCVMACFFVLRLYDLVSDVVAFLVLFTGVILLLWRYSER